MKAKIVTTITTWVDLETFDPEHQVSIDASDADGFPESAIYATVIGACRTTIKTVEART